MAAAVADARGKRSRDLGKEQFQWNDPKVVYTFPEGHELAGYSVVHLDDPTDTALLGRTMGHCSGTHFIWTTEERIWYFFSILGPNGQPHCTIHAKQKKWLNKPHPRDAAPPMPVKARGGAKICAKCTGYGGFVNGKAAYWGPEKGATKCDNCNGQGRISPPGTVRPSVGMYPNFEDVKKAFSELKIEYEAKYAPLQYKSCAYDIGVNRAHNNNPESFDYVYGDPVRAFRGKPDSIPDELWQNFVKASKAMVDYHDSKNKMVTLNGRVFKFDGKELIILSFSVKGDSYSGSSKYRRGFHDFLVELGKRKKEEKTA